MIMLFVNILKVHNLHVSFYGTRNLNGNKPQGTKCDFHLHACSLYVNSQSLCVFVKIQKSNY